MREMVNESIIIRVAKNMAQHRPDFNNNAIRR